MAPVGPIGIIPLKGSIEFSDSVNYFLNKDDPHQEHQSASIRFFAPIIALME